MVCYYLTFTSTYIKFITFGLLLSVQSNYRPLPQLPTTLPTYDTTLRSPTKKSSSSAPHTTVLTDEMAAELHTQRAKKRTQVHCGAKVATIPSK